MYETSPIVIDSSSNIRSKLQAYFGRLKVYFSLLTMFYVYNIETKQVEKVAKIDKVIHRHRNSKEEFTFEEETIESEVETPVKKAGRPKSK